MPTIAQSTIVLDTPEVTSPASQLAVAGVPVSATALRALLPPGEVLATVTASGMSKLGSASPLHPVWQSAPKNVTASSAANALSTAPPPPKIVIGSYVTTSVGNSFSFYIDHVPSNNVVGYNVYRNTWNGMNGSTRVQCIPQPFTNEESIQVSDPMPQSANTTYYYWLTAVNDNQQESAPISVGEGSLGGVPQPVTSINAVQSPYKTPDGRIFCLVAVDFTPAMNDPFFLSANIYFTGYTGTQIPQLMNNSTSSPAEFLCEITNETVTVTVVSVSSSGIESAFGTAPTALLTLNGSVSAPPYPSIYQDQVALEGNTGWQFTFNVIGGLEHDQIQCYRIYHSENNVTPVPPSNYFRTIPQPHTNVGQEVVQEVTGDLLFYWISAVNTAGLESELNPVPFTYIDPGSPPPNVNPVLTTKSYIPTVLVNGWAKSAHVGWWESADCTSPTSGPNFGLSASQAPIAFSNPDNAMDGSTSTAATFSEAHTGMYGACVWGFSTFPGLNSGASITSASLSVLSQVSQTSGPVKGEASLWYSTNNGSTWTEIYLATYQNGGNALRSKQTDTVTLPNTVDPTQLMVMACAHSHDDLAMSVYEIALTITQSGTPGPQQVSGVIAELVGGDVQLTWNALVPLTRTDILDYKVYRALHGAGYTQSHLQASIAPSSGATYSWTDVEAHDGTWDYWVVAVNSTGYSPSSVVAHLQGAASVLYTNGSTVASLQPAQAGADVTGTNTALDTVHVNGAAASSISPIAGLMPAQAGADVTGTNTALNTHNVGNQTADSVAGAATAILLQNPNFAAGNVGWNLQAGWSINSTTVPNHVGGSGYILVYSGTGTAGAYNLQIITCSAGAVIAVSNYMKAADPGCTGSLKLQIEFKDATGALVTGGSFKSSAASINDWTPYRVVGTAPAGSAYALISVAMYGATTTDWWGACGFAASIMPNSLDDVPDGTVYARPKSGFLSNGVPYTWSGEWSNVTSYAVGQEVGYGYNYWICIVANTNVIPGTSGDWQLVGPATLDNVVDGTVYRKPVGISTGGQTTTASYTANSISSSIVESVTSYVSIAPSGTVATISGMTVNGGYVVLDVCGAIASTNAAGIGWGLSFYRNGVALTPAFSYQTFATPGDSKYKPFSFSILDSSPGTGPNTYTVVVNTNSTGTASLIPVSFTAINYKA